MKHFLLLLITGALLFSCSGNSTQEAIERRIIYDAMGVELNPKFESISTIREVTVRESIDGMKMWFHDDAVMNMSDEEFKDKLNNQIGDAYDEISEKRTRQALNRITQYLNKSDDDLAYKIVEAKYSVVNPLLNNATVHVSNVYFIDYNNEVLFNISSEDWNVVMKDEEMPKGMEGIEQIVRVAYAKEL